jgi:type I restriction enzyme, S subunit
VADVTGGLTKNRSRDILVDRVPYLRVANVYANELRLDDLAEIGCSPAEFDKTRLMNGDLLIVEGNGSIEQIRRVAVWRGEVEGCSHQNHIIRARPHDDLVSSYGLFWLLSPGGRKAVEGVASSSSGLHTLSISKVNGLPIPYCEPEEQAEIVRRIEAAFTWVDQVGADQARTSQLLPKLDAAILGKAFRGELVPQDPNDEPAEILLGRIREARPAESKKPRQRVTRDKAMIRDPKELLLRDSEGWPPKGLPFEEIAQRVQLPYDEMRDALFALLEGDAPRLRQVFDKDPGCMYLRRVSQ